MPGKEQAKEPFHERLKRLVGSATTELAASIGVKEGTVYKWLRGDSWPDVPNFLRLATYLGISPYLLAGEAEPRSSAATAPTQPETESPAPVVTLDSIRELVAAEVTKAFAEAGEIRGLIQQIEAPEVPRARKRKRA